MENIHKNILHLEPEKGLLNDPNGLTYYDGKYYVFHQWNRFKMDHSYKEWGLFTSQDLLHWQNEGSAILPDSPKDKDGVYSGSAVVDKNKLHVFFTGNTKTNNQRKSYQRQAILNSNHSFIKDNDAIETPDDYTEHFRDPYITKENKEWELILGAQTKNYQGAVGIFTSDNLKDWQYRGIYYTNSTLDQMCECPNLVGFGEKKVLLVCPQKREINPDKDISSYAGYMVGKQKNYKFLPKTDIKHLDLGFDFYAPQVFEDKQGRKIMLAWMSRMSEEQEKKCPTCKFGYVHCLTLPRELILKNDKLYQLPLKEYKDSAILVNKYQDENIEFNSTKDFDIYEINLQENADFQISLFNQNIQLNYKDGQLIFRRKNWLNDQYEEKNIEIENIKKLEFYCDRSALEIFINDGEEVMSSRFFCNQKERKNIFKSNKQFNLEIRSLKL